MTKYEQAVESINRSFKNKDITKEERDEKLKKAEKFKEPDEKSESKTSEPKESKKTENKSDYLKGKKTQQKVEIAKTKENDAIIQALKKVKETQWVGNKTFDDLETCLASINLNTSNSGWYVPTPTKINGLKGIYAVNEDGTLHFEHRIIKENNKYKIETLSTTAFNEFEKMYNQILNGGSVGPETNSKIEECKQTIKEFQEKQKEKKAEKLRQTYLQQAITQEDRQKIEQMTVAEILKDANPPARIDVASKKSLEAVIKRNILHRYKKLSNEKQSEIKPKIKEIIKDILDELYPEFDKRLDKYFK